MSDTLLTEKFLIGENVLRVATTRMEWIFETFPSVCLSFSGGKDSTVLFHLAAEVARRRKRHFSVLFIDWEAQYQCTIEHIKKMGNDSNLLIVFYVQIMPDDFVMQLHRF